jgi:hypothetical protein
LVFVALAIIYAVVAVIGPHIARAAARPAAPATEWVVTAREFLNWPVGERAAYIMGVWHATTDIGAVTCGAETPGTGIFMYTIMAAEKFPEKSALYAAATGMVRAGCTFNKQIAIPAP